ncbi:protein MFI isoform 2-T2 [Anomaloglossus baeobatrachus]
MNVFRYFKNLLSFKAQGDPRLLLKCINPREAGLIDAATGVHVRFRLGGTRFPPNIYYKLFTHRPIVDMCANSPKDYTKQSVKQLLPGQIHNHGVIPQQDRNGWYARVENNGWRLLTLRLSDRLDEVTVADNRRRIPFSHSKLQRKQEVLKKQKKRKIEWMRKMYYEGSLHAQTTEPNTAVLVQRATEGVIKSVKQHGPQAVLDWEVDELLNWTNALNYDEYISSWKAVGTSKSSCAFTGTALVRSPYDVYEFSQLSPPALFSLTTSMEEVE